MARCREGYTILPVMPIFDRKCQVVEKDTQDFTVIALYDSKVSNSEKGYTILSVVLCLSQKIENSKRGDTILPVMLYSMKECMFSQLVPSIFPAVKEATRILGNVLYATEHAMLWKRLHDFVSSAHTVLNVYS